jgi:hypothetical protein
MEPGGRADARAVHGGAQVDGKGKRNGALTRLCRFRVVVGPPLRHRRQRARPRGTFDAPPRVGRHLSNFREPLVPHQDRGATSPAPEPHRQVARCWGQAPARRSQPAAMAADPAVGLAGGQSGLHAAVDGRTVEFRPPAVPARLRYITGARAGLPVERR